MAKPPKHKRGYAPFTTKQDFVDEKGLIIYKEHKGFFLPADAPFKCAGTDKGNKLWHYLTIHGKHIALKLNEHNLSGIYSLCDDYLLWLISRFSKKRWNKDEEEWEYTGVVDKDAVHKLLMIGGGEMGVIDLTEKRVLAGAYNIDGDLYLHHGDVVSMYGGKKKTHRIEKLGFIADKMFLADDKGDRLDIDQDGNWIVPDPTKSQAEAAWHELMEMISTWNWKRDILDPQLFLGFLLSSVFAGALPWCSSAWVQGMAGTGKSSLVAFAESFTGGKGGANFRSVEPTIASLRRKLSNSSVLAILDEQQVKKSDQIEKLFDLVRAASSGDKMTITAPDGVNVEEYRLHSAFLFFGVHFLQMEEQNESRLILFNINKIKADQEEIDKPIFFARVEELAEIVKFYIARNWHEFAKRDKNVRKFLQDKGLEQRQRDQIAALMTFGSWLPYEKMPKHADLDAYFPDIDEAAKQHFGEPIWKSCQSQLLSATTIIEFKDAEGVEKTTITIGKIIEHIHQTEGAEQLKTHHNDDRNDTIKIYRDYGFYTETLERNGCKIVIRAGRRYLFIADSNAILGQIYRGTVFAGATGKEHNWNTYIITNPDASRTDDKGNPFKIRIAGSLEAGLAIPLNKLLGDDHD